PQAGRDRQLEGLIANGERTFHAAAEGSQAWADAFRALPAFESRSRVALKELDRFAVDAVPFLEQFQPTERALSPLLTAAVPFAPRFNSFLTSLGPLTKAARNVLPQGKPMRGAATALREPPRRGQHLPPPLRPRPARAGPESRPCFPNFPAATQAKFQTSLRAAD